MIEFEFESVVNLRVQWTRNVMICCISHVCKLSTTSRGAAANVHTELQVAKLALSPPHNTTHHTPHTRQPAPVSIPLCTPSHSTTMTSTIGIPIKLLNESTVSEIAKCLRRPALCLQELSQLTRDATGPPSHG
jgi:hypothetical protein